MEKINESSNEEKDVESSKLNFPGERVKLDWDEIRKGVLAPDTPETKTPELSHSETADSIPKPPQFSSINIPVEAFEFQKEAPEEDREFKTKEEDVLTGEEFSRPSISEIIDSKQIVESKEINEAKKELEEMFSRFSGDQNDIKEKIEELEEMFDRPSKTPSPLVKEDGPLEDQEELLNSQPSSFVPLPPKEITPTTEIATLENQIDQKNQEIKKISDLSEKFEIPTKTETSLSTEITDLKNEKETLEDSSQTKKEKSWAEKQKEKVLSFIKGKKLETEQKAESLSPEKKTLLKKITDIAKNKKVQAAVVGSILLGISVTVPPVGGAAWLTHGLITGFLPAEYGLGLIYTGIASGSGLIGASGAGSAILRKIIEQRTEKKNVAQEIKKENSTEDSVNTETQTTKAEKIANFAKGVAETAKGIVKPLPPKPETKNLKEALIEKVNNFADLFKALKDLNEKGIDADEIEKDIELIQTQVNAEKEKNRKEFLIDLTTGHNDKDDVSVKNLGINIPEDYGIAKKVNSLLKAEIENPSKKAETETQEVVPVEKEEIGIVEAKSFNTFDELYDEIKKNEKEAESIIANIEQIRKNIAEKGDIFEYLVKVPKNILPKLQEVIKKGGVIKSTEGIKKEAQEKMRNFSSVKNFDDLLFKPDLGLTEDEKTNIRFIRIGGQKEIDSLEKDLRIAVLGLLEKDEKIITETHDTTSFYDALKKICDSADTQNSFSYTKIIDSMRRYINPDPKNDREKVLQEIPKIYGIRKKFLDLCSEEINKSKTLEEPSIPKEFIENNPEVLVTGAIPKETTDKGPIATKIQEVVEKTISETISKTTSLPSLFNVLRKMTGDVFDYNETTDMINNMDNYNPNLSPEEKAKLLEKIPEIYGIRKKFLYFESNDSFPKNTETNGEIIPQEISDNESITAKTQETKEVSSLKKEQNMDTKEEKEKKLIEKNEKILEETDDLDEFRDAVNGLGFDGDYLLSLLNKMLKEEEGETYFDEFPEEHEIREAAIRIWEKK